MKFLTRNAGVIALVAIVIAIGGYFYPQMAAQLGAVTGETNYSGLGITSLKIGSSCGDGFTSSAANGCETTTHLMTTSCAMKADVSIAASTTGYAYCTGVTGVTSSDKVIAQFATSTANWAFADYFAIVTAKSSTTAGAVDFEVYNGTGAAAAPSAVSKTASTTNLLIVQ